MDCGLLGIYVLLFIIGIFLILFDVKENFLKHTVPQEFTAQILDYAQ